jgi:hypothetical protein
MLKVVIESPYVGDLVRNIKYARLCLLDSLKRGEAPYLSHLIYPLVLDDRVPEQRKTGIQAGLEWGRVADLRVVYIDYGITSGMKKGIEDAKIIHQPIKYRRIMGK